jgi:hypothetical protein
MRKRDTQAGLGDLEKLICQYPGVSRELLESVRQGIQMSPNSQEKV